MMRSLSTIALTCIGLLLLSGCQIMDSLPPEKASSSSSGDVLFHDDFSDTSSGWRVWDTSEANITYADGGLRFYVNQPNYDYWSLPGKEYTDVTLAVDALLEEGPTDNDFGLICRMQDEYNFYAFLISSDGYGGIIKVKDGLYQVLNSETGLEYGSMINQDQNQNLIRADCIGEHLTMYVNHEKFLEVDDSDFSLGDAGLIAGSYNQPGVSILFDNFYVLKP